MPREAAGSAVSSRVRQSFGEKFVSRGREDKIKHVGYFWPREANSSVCAANARIWLSLINQLRIQYGVGGRTIGSSSCSFTSSS